MKDHNHLGSIANNNENQWVTLAIDCEKKVVGYGNRFHANAPMSLRKHLDWWLFEHLGVKFKWADIPVVKQNDPPFVQNSCVFWASTLVRSGALPASQTYCSIYGGGANQDVFANN
jgi:hypothetical protein